MVCKIRCRLTKDRREIRRAELKRFFREVSTVRGPALLGGLSLKTPELCASYLTAIFGKTAADLANHSLMVMREAYFRLRIVRPLVSFSVEKTPTKKEAIVCKAEKPVASTVTPLDDKKELSSRPCVGHLGRLLGAVNKDGRPYACKFGKDCTFRHISAEDKSKQRLLDIVGSLAAIPRADLTRAVVKRS